MKQLTKIKLINWHSFLNETIELTGSVLLSGENGAGKSTILDAVQFVMMASKNNFNKAAHEAGNRKLTGYVRYKTGQEKQPYERTGNVTCHVALEFFDQEKKDFFIAGAVVDSASEDSEKTIWYLIDNEKIKDELFFDQGGSICSIDVFRKNRASARVFKTKTEARSAYRHKFGRLEEKFFDLIPKSLAFKPIDDIKDFVYSYVLDKKEVNIEQLQENIMTYQSLTSQLRDIRARVGKLEYIIQEYENTKESNIARYGMDYFIARISKEQSEYLLEKKQEEIKEADRTLELLKKQEEVFRKKREQELEQYHNLLAECKNNQEFLALEQIEKERNEAQKKLDKYSRERKKLQKSISESIRNTSMLFQGQNHKNKNSDMGQQFVKVFSEPFFLSKENGNIQEYITGTDKDNIRLYAAAEKVLECMIQYKQHKKEKIQKEQYVLSEQMQKLEKEYHEIKEQVKRLEKKNLVYDPNVLKLKDAIEQELKKEGRSGEVYILCELLNVSRETWKNAVEGYLNQQRFYLLVEPENFDLAVSIYNAMHKRERFFGAGIINTAKLEQYNKAPKGSLAAVVTSKNIYAKRFVNMLLGRVMCCEKAEQLKEYEVSITPECMRYQNHVVSAISPKHYKTPYIGADAYKIQREQAEQKQQNTKQELEEVKNRLNALQKTIQLCDTSNEVDIKYGMEVFLVFVQENNRLMRLQKDKEECKANSSYIEKQIRLQTMEKQQKEQEKEYESILKKQGEAQTVRTLAIEGRKQLQEELLKKEKMVTFTEENLGDNLARFQMEYDKETKKIRQAQKEKEGIQAAYESIYKKISGKRARMERAMQADAAKVISAMQEYRITYQFGAAARMEEYPAYYQEYDKLKHSEILNYEERAERAREASEQEFREQFLAKLQENMKQAQQEFKKLNHSLQNIPFGRDHYQFECRPSKKYQAFYDMIMSDFNIMSGVSIFSGEFHEKNREVIEELFDRLLAGGENGAAIVEEFTDYRTYMDYDIRMENEDGNYSYYSKVCREKSGGETQTPFYVTVAASFVQLYENGIGGDSIGIVMFDEAFNNMDDERIGGVLGFFKELPLQLIIAAPPEKIQYIAPYVNSTILVMQGDKRSYIERFDMLNSH